MEKRPWDLKMRPCCWISQPAKFKIPLDFREIPTAKVKIRLAKTEIPSAKANRNMEIGKSDIGIGIRYQRKPKSRLGFAISCQGFHFRKQTFAASERDRTTP